MKRLCVVTCMFAALMTSGPANAATEVITVTQFIPYIEEACAGTQLLPVAGQPRCQAQPPGWPGTAAHNESSDESGNMNASVSASLGTPVLTEEAASQPALIAQIGLTGPADSVDVEATMDVDELVSSPVDFASILLGDVSIVQAAVRSGPSHDCTGTGVPTSSVEALIVGSVYGSPQPGGRVVYTTRLACTDGESLLGTVNVFAYVIAQAVSQSTGAVSASGSAHLRSVTFTVNYV